MSTTATAPVAHPPAAAGSGPGRLRYPRLSAAFAAVAGLLVTALGAGSAIRYLTKTGLTWTGVLGLFTLIAGVTLLAYAWLVYWRVSHGWQRLWFIPVVFVALLTMFSVAQGTMLAWAPRNSLGATTPAADGLTFNNVTFRTSDGVRMSAWLIPSTNHAAVVTMPGAGSTRTATLAQATVLAQHGYGVLMVDPRGQGQSGGGAMDAGWYGDRDVTAAVRFLRHQPGIDPNRIGVLGLSMGGEEAIGAAASDHGIRAVVAEGATHRTAADKAGYLPGGVAGAIQRGMDWLTYGTTAILSPAPEPDSLYSAIARANSTQFLLIAAGNGIDEPEATAYLHSAVPSRVHTWTVRGASHVHGLATSPAEWTSRVTTFLDLALG